MSQPVAKIDSVGVEKIIRNVISSKYQFHSMIGLHFENQTTATAYFRVRRRRDTTGGEAKIFYIIHNGWYIRSIHVAPRTMGHNSWENLLIKIEPTSELEPAEEEK